MGGCYRALRRVRSLPREAGASVGKNAAMSWTQSWSYSRARAVPSRQPYALAEELKRTEVAFETVGSALVEGPARDLDVVLDLDPVNLGRLCGLLEEIGTGPWRTRIEGLSANPDNVVTVQTVHGPLDIHPGRRT